jgi:uncharacterized protein YjiK
MIENRFEIEQTMKTLKLSGLAKVSHLTWSSATGTLFSVTVNSPPHWLTA